MNLQKDVPFISTTAVDCDWCTTNLSHGCLWLSNQGVVGIISSPQRSVLVPIGFCVVLSKVSKLLQVYSIAPVNVFNG